MLLVNLVHLVALELPVHREVQEELELLEQEELVQLDKVVLVEK